MDVLPEASSVFFPRQPSLTCRITQGNEQYGSQRYWDDRYAREAKGTTFDWFKRWTDLCDVLAPHLPDKTARICMLGCGNSSSCAV